jgi:nitrogen fixation protein FixH
MSDVQSADRAWRWFPWAIVGAFVVVIAVNGAAAYLALDTAPGLVTEHPFDVGNSYNELLDKGAAQDALGWQGAVQFSSTGPERGTLEVTMRDAAGRPLTGLAARAEIIRPVENLPAIEAALPLAAPGRYAAAVRLPRPGQWQVRVTLTRGSDSFLVGQRIFVP